MREDKQACTFGPESEYVELAAEVFALLADPTRIRIILALRDGEASVGELAERVGRPPTAVSQHLAKLRWARVVAVRQQGTRMHYRLIDGHARLLVQQAVFQAEHAVDEQPRHHGPAHGEAESRAEPRTESRAEPRTESRAEPRTESRAEPRTESRAEPGTEPRTEPGTESSGARRSRRTTATTRTGTTTTTTSTTARPRQKTTRGSR